MQTKISQLSHYVLELNAQARTRNVSDLVSWGVRSLADILGFDSAWYGWAQVQAAPGLVSTGTPPAKTVIHASSTYNLPHNYYQSWTAIADQDVLVDQFVENPRCVPIYDRTGGVQTDGMQHLADTYGIKQMATAMCLRDERTASLYISAYRGGRSARIWTRAEREFLQCAVDNMSVAAQVAARNDFASMDGLTTSIYFSNQGAVIVGLGKMRERFGHLWSRSDGDRVPRWLTEYADAPGEHLLVDQGLVVTCQPVSEREDFAFQKLSLRPILKFDLLTGRERDVARILANGRTHKEAARELGVSPSTIRNQTRSIYAKLEVDNRASLASLVPPPNA